MIPESGLRTHLKEFGFIKLFRKDFKKEDSRHYILYIPDEEKIKEITRNEFITIHDTHWGIETFHRAIKQVCGICRFMVRDSYAIKTHIFCSLQAFTALPAIMQYSFSPCPLLSKLSDLRMYLIAAGSAVLDWSLCGLKK